MAAGDPFRALPWRHIGHGFPIAAGFGYTIDPATHDLLTALATGYVITHAVHRGLNAPGPQVLMSVFDSLVFDGLASVFIPTVLTHHVRVIMQHICKNVRNPRPVVVWTPVVISLAALVFTWGRIDELVDDLLNQTLRKL